MAAKKNYYKKKLLEKKSEFLKQVIEEEINSFVNEQQYQQYGSSDIHGLQRLYKPESGTFTSALLSLPSSLISIAQHGLSKAVVQGLGLGLFAIAGSIAAIIPFNDPRVVKYLSDKIKYWEQTNLKMIDQQFEKELGEVWRGWDTMKTDLFGIGFVASPLNVIAAYVATAKGLDMAFSVANVVSGGWAQKLLQKFDKEIQDPGDLEDYLRKDIWDGQRRAEKTVERQIVSQHCLANLDQEDYFDPVCIGMNLRSDFPGGQAGTDAFTDFVRRNAERYYRKRSKYAERQGIKYSSRSNPEGLLSNIETELEKLGYVSEASLSQVVNKLTGKTSREKTNLPALESLHNKLDLWVSEKKITEDQAQNYLKKIFEKIETNPQVIQAAKSWSKNNLQKLFGNLFQDMNNSIISGKAGVVSPSEIAKYKQAIPKLVDSVFDQSRQKNKIPENVKKATEAYVQNLTATMPNQQAAQQQVVKPVPVTTVPSQPIKQKQ